MSSAPNQLLRVTQLNAVYLDKELLKTFQTVLTHSTRLLPPGFIAPYEPELNLLLKLGILNHSILKNGATFGQQLLSIKYENIPVYKRILYLVGNSLEYFKDRFEYCYPSHGFNDTMFNIGLILRLFNFLNFSSFLQNGAHPLLIERILGLNQVYVEGASERRFDSQYMAREILWNSFIDIFVYVATLINYHKLRRTVRNLNPFHKKPVMSSSQNVRTMTMHTKCVFCHGAPIMPHHMGCPHIFCYVCLKGNLEADAKFECPVCEHSNAVIICEKLHLV